MINKVILLGRLGGDAEVSHYDSGRSQAKFSMVTSRRFKTKDGEDREDSQWHNVIIWGNADRLDYIPEVFKKGKMVYVEGMVKYRAYEPEPGNKRYFTDIDASWPHGVLKVVSSQNSENSMQSTQNAGGSTSTPPQEIDVEKDIPTVDFGDLPPVE
ncbi:hypothetical protein CL645_05355 [bacterium]|jgi:single-strand DNA-binding protein|nr:hypothetical protein [bacterium]|tara:strand:+ start:2086 stop:2553 length:468 start_codon:yes stop_codon:yes gene_type:complete